MTPKARYEQLAADWAARGRPGSAVLRGWPLLGLWCWSHSPGGKADGQSPVLAAFIQEAVRIAGEDWIEDLCSERESCRVCGEVYRAENLRLCTDCMDTYCYRCAAAQPAAANGNVTCGCGGELVG